MMKTLLRPVIVYVHKFSQVRFYDDGYGNDRNIKITDETEHLAVGSNDSPVINPASLEPRFVGYEVATNTEYVFVIKTNPLHLVNHVPGDFLKFINQNVTSLPCRFIVHYEGFCIESVVVSSRKNLDLAILHTVKNLNANPLAVDKGVLRQCTLTFISHSKGWRTSLDLNAIPKSVTSVPFVLPSASKVSKASKTSKTTKPLNRKNNSDSETTKVNNTNTSVKPFSEKKKNFSVINYAKRMGVRLYSTQTGYSSVDSGVVYKKFENSDQLNSKHVNNDMFNQLNSYLIQNNYKSNKEIQTSIEKYLKDYSLVNVSDSLVHEVYTRLLGGEHTKNIQAKSVLVKTYIDKLFSQSNTKKNGLILAVLKTVGEQFVYDLLIFTYLKIVSHSGTENTDNFGVLKVTIRVGKQAIDKYFRLEKGDSKLGYKSWLTKYKQSNKQLFDKIEIDDSFYSALGSQLMDVLIFAEMIDTVVTSISRTEKRSDFVVTDKEILNMSKKQSLKVIPLKLPMIVPPKDYSEKELGGYLLNDVDHADEIFSSRKGYKNTSMIDNNNKLFYLVNNVSKTPFKVNKEVLDFILSDKGKNLILNESDLIGYTNCKTLTKYKQEKYKSLQSKFVLQEYILKIVDIYKNFSCFYFPVRLDNRGRLYCIPPFFNYQSNDLAKSLILFSIPGTVDKQDLDSIKYLKSYGVNCFGGEASKSSLREKISWVDNNLEDIINYDNCKLLNKAKEKLLFLAFCIEYKKFHSFLMDENRSEFQCYLPIQLDATCNGFQHLSLLSHESKLYEELNLSNKSNTPKDFYAFLLHKVTAYIKHKLDNDIDEQGSASFSRLNKFILGRAHVKKVIMTIPYNATDRSMREYIANELTLKNYDEEIGDKIYVEPNHPNGPVLRGADIYLLIKTIRHIIDTDYSKIGKLIKYLRNVAQLCNVLNLPIYWALPSGLKIYQSYLESKSISISPFTYNKLKLNLRVTNKTKFDHEKQIRALMPNLIHSLDAYSMTELYYWFTKGKSNGEKQFYSIHDCFGTTVDKVDLLKGLLVYIYVTLYSDDHYLEKFDNGVINFIKDNTEYEWKGRTIILDDYEYELFDIKWVLNNKLLGAEQVKKIDSQHILI